MHPRLKLTDCLLVVCLLFSLQPICVLAQGQESADNETLQQQLDATNKQFTARMDPAVVKNINEAVKEIQGSEILANAKNEGDQAPDFTLPDATGKKVHLYELLKKGPVVLTWYRGNW